MTKIAIIGTQGMLGSAVCRYLSEQNHQIIEINSNGKTRNDNPVIQFDIALDGTEKLEKNLKDVDVVINCAGLIKHKIIEESIKSLNNLIRINALFPIQLTNLSHNLNFKVIQVATDCVYSGVLGDYSEDDTKDPVDLYGYSKVLGEHYDENLLTLRCSLIGRELKSKIEFLEWVLSHSKEFEINGFTDHIWNGLTTLHFAKIVNGIINANNFKAGTFHLVPLDSVSKHDLIKIIMEYFESNGVKIIKCKSSKAINRTLTTNNKQSNNDMWRNAGYNNPLSISEMVKEYANWA